MNEEAIARIGVRELDTATMPTLDVRTHAGKEQVRGALRYDLKHLLSATKLALPLPHDRPIAVYADDEERALEVASCLREQGYSQAAILEGGFDAYRDAGLPTEELTQQQPIPGSESGIPRL